MELQEKTLQHNQLLQEFAEYFKNLKTTSKDTRIAHLAEDSENGIVKYIEKLKQTNGEPAAMLQVLQALNGFVTRGILDWGPWPEEVNKKIREDYDKIFEFHKYLSGIVFPK